MTSTSEADHINYYRQQQPSDGTPPHVAVMIFEIPIDHIPTNAWPASASSSSSPTSTSSSPASTSSTRGQSDEATTLAPAAGLYLLARRRGSVATAPAATTTTTLSRAQAARLFTLPAMPALSSNDDDRIFSTTTLVHEGMASFAQKHQRLPTMSSVESARFATRKSHSVSSASWRPNAAPLTCALASVASKLRLPRLLAS